MQSQTVSIMKQAEERIAQLSSQNESLLAEVARLRQGAPITSAGTGAAAELAALEQRNKELEDGKRMAESAMVSLQFQIQRMQVTLDERQAAESAIAAASSAEIEAQAKRAKKLEVQVQHQTAELYQMSQAMNSLREEAAYAQTQVSQA